MVRHVGYCQLDYKWCGGDCGSCSGPLYKSTFRVKVGCSKCRWTGPRNLSISRIPLDSAKKGYIGAVLERKCPKCKEKVSVKEILRKLL